MPIQRRQKPFHLTGYSLVLWESSWDSAMARAALEADAREEKAKLNGHGDPERLYFHEMIYAPLAAASTGDVPGVEAAYALLPEELDAWFEAAREVDPTSFVADQTLPELVTFRDGTQITVLPDYLPSVLLRRHRLEAEAQAGEAEPTVSAETFRLFYYPRLAGCSIGDVPSRDDARSQWPATELDKWYGAARRVNPKLFLPLEEIALAHQAEALESQKKKEHSPRRSRSSSDRS